MARKKEGAIMVPTPQEPEQVDLFRCEIKDWPLKDDIASMEIPLFSLAKNPDTKTRVYRRGNKTVRIMPSGEGSATVFDKDLLIYAASQIVEARNRGLPVSRTLVIESIDFLMSTGRGDSRTSYENIMGMLRRLKGTAVETNIPTGGVVRTEGFSMIDNYVVLSEERRIISKKDPSTGEATPVDVSRPLRFKIVISEWLMNGLLEYEVLTLDRKYFTLSKSIERRLYEVARKHCGYQPLWKIDIDLLAEKVGTTRDRAHFREDLRAVMDEDSIPEYKIALDRAKRPDDVVFYTKDSAKLSKALMEGEMFQWFGTLYRDRRD